MTVGSYSGGGDSNTSGAGRNRSADLAELNADPGRGTSALRGTRHVSHLAACDRGRGRRFPRIGAALLRHQSRPHQRRGRPRTGVVAGVLAQPAPPPADSIAEIGRRIAAVLTEEPEVVDYLVDALVSGRDLGNVVFDALAARGADRWQERSDLGLTRPDLDPLWASLNPLVLALGALILRPHLDRHLPEPFSTPAQIHRWNESNIALLREGAVRNSGPGGVSAENPGGSIP